MTTECQHEWVYLQEVDADECAHCACWRSVLSYKSELEQLAKISSAQIEALREEADAAKRSVEELRAALAKCEYARIRLGVIGPVSTHTDYEFCPICNEEPGAPHDDGCVIPRLLARTAPK